MTTIAEYIKQHPNTGKVIVYTEAYLQMRHTLIEQIATIENNIKDTLLSNDVDIRQKLLPSLKRTLRGLDKRFLRAGGMQDPVYCARLIAEFEREQIKEPLQYCRYYTGNDNKAESEQIGVLYDYERIWVQFILKGGYEPNFVRMIAEYMGCGLMYFPEHWNTPISLMAILFNRFSHWERADIESFKEWYFVRYNKNTL